MIDKTMDDMPKEKESSQAHIIKDPARKKDTSQSGSPIIAYSVVLGIGTIPANFLLSGMYPHRLNFGSELLLRAGRELSQVAFHAQILNNTLYYIAIFVGVWVGLNLMVSLLTGRPYSILIGIVYPIFAVILGASVIYLDWYVLQILRLPDQSIVEILKHEIATNQSMLSQITIGVIAAAAVSVGIYRLCSVLAILLHVISAPFQLQLPKTANQKAVKTLLGDTWKYVVCSGLLLLYIHVLPQYASRDNLMFVVLFIPLIDVLMNGIGFLFPPVIKALVFLTRPLRKEPIE